jgi:hypothetical protein
MCLKGKKYFIFIFISKIILSTVHKRTHASIQNSHSILNFVQFIWLYIWEVEGRNSTLLLEIYSKCYTMHVMHSSQTGYKLSYSCSTTKEK